MLYCMEKQEIAAILAFFRKNTLFFKLFCLLLQSFRGRNPGHDCMSLLFRACRKEVGNLFGIVAI